MATVDGLTKARMLAIEAASIVNARVDPVTHHLILTKHDGTDIDVGNLQGPQGVQGVPGTPAPVLTPAATVAGPAAFGDAPLVGVSVDYARKDHLHGLPAAPPAGHCLIPGWTSNIPNGSGALPATVMSRTLGNGKTQAAMAMARAGNITGFSLIEVVQGPLGVNVNRTYQVYKNGIATPLSAVMNTGAAGTYYASMAGGPVPYVAGDLLDVRYSIVGNFSSNNIEAEASIEIGP